MKVLTVGCILGWLGLAYSYHLAPPVNPTRKTTTPTPKPTTTTVPVEYEAPEIEGPVSTTTTVATTTTTTTKKPTTRAHGHGPHHGGYYDQYGQYHYGPYYNPHSDPYGGYRAPYDPYGRHASRAPHPNQAPYPSQAPHGSGAQHPYTDPYAPQYDPSTGHYSNPNYGAGKGLKPNGQSALMDQLSITKSPRPSETPSGRNSGRWIEMRAANDLRMKSSRRNRQGAARRRGYFPRREQQMLTRKPPSGSNYNNGSKSRPGGREANWRNKQQPRRRQQQGASRRRGNNKQGRRNRWNKQNTGGGYNARNNQQPQDAARNEGGISQPLSGNPGSSYQNQNAAAGNRYNTASPSNAYANAASQAGNAAVQPSPYPGPASAQAQNSNYYNQGGSAYNQGQGTTAGNAYNMGVSSNQGASYNNAAATYQQGFTNYGTETGAGTVFGTGSGTNTAAFNTPNYNSAVVPGQQPRYNNDQYNANQGSGVDMFGLGNNQGPSYNYNNQAMQIANYDASGNQMQSDAYNSAGSWGGQNSNRNNQNSQSNWNTGNSFGQGQTPNAVKDSIGGYMTMNNANSMSASKSDSTNTGSSSTGTNQQNVAQTMLKMLETLKTAAANATSATSSSSRTSNTQESVQISKGMEAAIKTAILNAAKDLSNKMTQKKATPYVGTQETYQMPPSVQAVDTPFKAAVPSPLGWAQPTTTAQSWTQAPVTTPAPAAAPNQWGPTGGLWGPSAPFNYYQVTTPAGGNAGGPWGTPAPTTPNVSFLGAMSRNRSSPTSTMMPRTGMNPMQGFQQMLLASAFFNKK
ncbi:hornerin-like [Mizuhopecten yessoensis]|uniref:Uncharacterized protein n=1 Tax=Mizuhopecten yessoensis TaxID=6573 RepID=A0A210QIK1_MIZYE|nr:hornerin-like [Mizuhopecten yessoensis]XP_021357309.1 hornerin-like [Mizuhopecten yessoensis]OWF48570.1 hypothetical protein KP79_PYT19646 [Mizuhopecten yessoensis]